MNDKKIYNRMTINDGSLDDFDNLNFMTINDDVNDKQNDNQFFKKKLHIAQKIQRLENEKNRKYFEEHKNNVENVLHVHQTRPLTKSNQMIIDTLDSIYR